MDLISLGHDATKLIETLSESHSRMFSSDIRECFNQIIGKLNGGKKRGNIYLFYMTEELRIEQCKIIEEFFISRGIKIKIKPDLVKDASDKEFNCYNYKWSMGK